MPRASRYARRSSTWVATSSGRGSCEPRRAAAAPVDGVDGDVARAREGLREAVDLLRGAQGRRGAGAGCRGPEPVTRQPMASPPGRASSPAGSPATSARTASRRSLPPPVRGRASRRTHATGTLNPARDARAWAARSSSRGVAAPSRDDDRGDRHVAERCVGSRDDGGVRDGRVLEQDLLDLGRRDVLAAADDAVQPAVDDPQPPVGVEAPEVAGVDRVVGRRRGLVAADGAARAGGRPDDDLADAVGARVGDRRRGRRAAGGPRTRDGRAPRGSGGRSRPRRSRSGRRSGRRASRPRGHGSRARAGSGRRRRGRRTAWRAAGRRSRRGGARAGPGPARRGWAPGPRAARRGARRGRRAGRRGSGRRRAARATRSPARPRARGRARGPSRSPAAGRPATTRRWRPSRGGTGPRPWVRRSCPR